MHPHGGAIGAEIERLHDRHAWQPFTQMKLTPPPLVIERAQGSLLFTADGKQIIDAIGSWWTSIHGHNHPEITSAVKSAVDSIDHVMYAGLTHPGAALLSGRLSQKTQGRLPRVFFSDNGSTAVEVALKMAFQYFVNAGRSEKQKFVSLANGYHGDTIGTMSVGSRSVFHAMYKSLLFPVISTPAPGYHSASRTDLALAAGDVEPAVAALKALLSVHAESICALIMEPLIQGAAGMKMHHPLFLQKVRELCGTQYNVFLIADEVFTGCGRTGTFFAFEQAGVWPDLIAVSKGLSAGTVAFAATLASEQIFQGFYSDDRTHTLFHGHSMTGSAVGCAAALASLDIFQRENTLDRVQQLEKSHESHMARLAAGRMAPWIKETRALGSVAAVELKIAAGYLSDFSARFGRKCTERGVLLRPLGNVIYLTPPYNIEPAHLATAYGVLEETAVEMLAEGGLAE